MIQKTEKSFSIHCRELVAIVLLSIASKVAPDHLKPYCNYAIKMASKIAKGEVPRIANKNH
jgi:hypothetical protein